MDISSLTTASKRNKDTIIPSLIITCGQNEGKQKLPLLPAFTSSYLSSARKQEGQRTEQKASYMPICPFFSFPDKQHAIIAERNLSIRPLRKRRERL